MDDDHLQLEMGMSTIRVSLDLNDIRMAKQNLTKAEQTGVDDKFMTSRLEKCAGLVYLLDGEYKTAAHHFISAADGSDFPEIISNSDVTLFGTICALASFDRNELRKKIVDNIDFKAEMESTKAYVNASKNLASNFCMGQYSNLFSVLKELYPFLRIDVHMSNHVDKLYEKIREKCIAQYFAPYSALDMCRMSEHLQIPLENLYPILVKMISNDQIDAAIDSGSNILYRRKKNGLKDTYSRVASLGKAHLHDLKGILLRLSFMKNGFSLESDIGTGTTKPLGTAGSFDNGDCDDGNGEMDIEQMDEESAP
jgi:COP9 signalosome complex subunit 1